MSAITINLDNLKQDDSYPVTGFLRGENILSNEDYEKLLLFDYDNLEAVSYCKHRRAFTPEHNISYANEASLVLQKIATYFAQFEVLETLLNKSFEDSNFSISMFWLGGIEGVKRLYKHGWLALNEDSNEFEMAPHVDNRVIIANLIIYLASDLCHNIGTSFHELGNLSNSKQIPFIGNSACFFVNTEYSFHSVAVVPLGVKRRSIIFSWTI